jgi:hypothetical protein
MMTATTPANAAMTNAVSLKLPTFWSSQPTVWFVQAEAQFHIRSITDDTTKYYYVVAALDQSTAGRLVDILSQPPATDKYKHLKQLVNLEILRTRFDYFVGSVIRLLEWSAMCITTNEDVFTVTQSSWYPCSRGTVLRCWNGS